MTFTNIGSTFCVTHMTPHMLFSQWDRIGQWYEISLKVYEVIWHVLPSKCSIGSSKVATNVGYLKAHSHIQMSRKLNLFKMNYYNDPGMIQNKSLRSCEEYTNGRNPLNSSQCNKTERSTPIIWICSDFIIFLCGPGFPWLGPTKYLPFN